MRSSVPGAPTRRTSRQSNRQSVTRPSTSPRIGWRNASTRTMLTIRVRPQRAPAAGGRATPAVARKRSPRCWGRLPCNAPTTTPAALAAGGVSARPGPGLQGTAASPAITRAGGIDGLRGQLRHVAKAIYGPGTDLADRWASDRRAPDETGRLDAPQPAMLASQACTRPFEWFPETGNPPAGGGGR